AALQRLIVAYETRAAFTQVAGCMQLLIKLQEPAEAALTSHTLAELAMQRLSDHAMAEQALRLAIALDPQNPQSLERLRTHLTAIQAYDRLAELLAEEAERASSPVERASLLHKVASLYENELQDPA